MSPALIPHPETYKENLDDATKGHSKHLRAPGYKWPIEVDYFDKIKNGSSIMSHPAGQEIISVFGCKSCRWVNTDCCPHKGDVTHMKPHMNRICSERLKIPLSLHEDGVRMTGKRMLQVRGLMDAAYFSKYVQDQAFEKKRDINDVFAWEKLQADILREMIKQDEGSKLQVERKFSPSDLASLIDGAKEVKEVEVGSNAVRKEKEEDVKDEFEQYPPSFEDDKNE